MKATRWSGFILLLLCIGVSLAWSIQLRKAVDGSFVMTDFGGIYFESLCALRGKDPYNQVGPLEEFKRAKEELPQDIRQARVDMTIVAVCVYLPTALFLLAPFSLLPWSTAQVVWAAASALVLLIGALLVLNLARAGSGRLSTLLACLVLVNCPEILFSGNVAAVVVGLCIAGSWCFLTERYAGLGVILLSVALVLKPHDVGFVWLYFLLAGGVRKKFAIQSLGMAMLIGICAALWITPVSPHWIWELKSNNEAVSALGSTSDPGPAGLTHGGLASVIDLQAMFSIFHNDPHFYNPIAYGLGGALLLIWMAAVVRKQKTNETSLLAIGAVSVLTLLPVYHRPYDAKLLLLTIPACAILWKEGGGRRWIAVILTFAAILSTSDIPLAVLIQLRRTISISLDSLVGKMVAVFLLQPTPLILLLTGCFYLWAFITYVPSEQVPSLPLEKAAVPVRNS